MPNNYVLLETIALTQSAASVTFDNLPTSGYTDLKVVMSVRDTYNVTVSAAIFVNFNGSSSSLSSRYLQGAGSGTPVSATLGSLALAGLNTAALATANTFSNIELYIPNYRSSNFKSFSIDSVTENNATEAYTNFVAGLWSNTAAITSIALTCGVAFTANSTFSLYGIAALGTTPTLAPKATGGNIVANDGTFWYHAFTSSGNFVPQVGLTADCLVVAGGGGSSSSYGGGGGAGGLLAFTAQSLANGTNYACTIGAGGAVGTAGASNGVNGVDSQFGALTLVKGGGGGAYTGNANAGSSGASGGGGAGFYGGAGGAATPSGQGNAGGAGLGASIKASGGGGGAGAVGGSAAGTTSGAGGNGSSAYSSWGLATNTGQNVSGTTYYAGGGAGGADGSGAATGVGAGGFGGGGAAGFGTFPTAVNGTSGTPNTGGGGGGASQTGTSGAGGSGIIIIRYPIA